VASLVRCFQSTLAAGDYNCRCDPGDRLHACRPDDLLEDILALASGGRGERCPHSRFTVAGGVSQARVPAAGEPFAGRVAPFTAA
jgi:hypothetical protein